MFARVNCDEKDDDYDGDDDRNENYTFARGNFCPHC